MTLWMKNEEQRGPGGFASYTDAMDAFLDAEKAYKAELRTLSESERVDAMKRGARGFVNACDAEGPRTTGNGWNWVLRKGGM